MPESSCVPYRESAAFKDLLPLRNSLAKFRTYAKPRMSAVRIEEVIGTVARLEELGSVRKLMDLLRLEEKVGTRKAAVG